MTKAEIKNWQKALRKQGFFSDHQKYNDVVIDGDIGKNTQKAIEICRDWQTYLNKKGYGAGTVDGWPGLKTISALKKFQLKANIKVDGIYGPSTLNARMKLVSKPKQIIRRVIDSVITPIAGFSLVYGGRRWDNLVLHISVSSFGGAATINKWHRGFGWRKGGYHAVVKLDGTIQTGDEFPNLLRTSTEIGAHIFGFNRVSYGLCFISLDGKITDEQFRAGKKFIAFLRGKGVGASETDGHNSFPNQATACPGELPVSSLRGF